MICRRWHPPRDSHHRLRSEKPIWKRLRTPGQCRPGPSRTYEVHEGANWGSLSCFPRVTRASARPRRGGSQSSNDPHSPGAQARCSSAATRRRPWCSSREIGLQVLAGTSLGPDLRHPDIRRLDAHSHAHSGQLLARVGVGKRRRPVPLDIVGRLPMSRCHVCSARCPRLPQASGHRDDIAPPR